MSEQELEAGLPDHRQRRAEGRTGRDEASATVRAGGDRARLGARVRGCGRRRALQRGEPLRRCASRGRHRRRRPSERRRPLDGRLEGRRARRDRRYLEAPAPGATLALVAREVRKASPLAKACAKAGRVLEYSAGKKAVGWVSERFQQAGVSVRPGRVRGACPSRRRRPPCTRGRGRQGGDVGGQTIRSPSARSRCSSPRSPTHRRSRSPTRGPSTTRGARSRRPSGSSIAPTGRGETRPPACRRRSVATPPG